MAAPKMAAAAWALDNLRVFEQNTPPKMLQTLHPLSKLAYDRQRLLELRSSSDFGLINTTTLECLRDLGVLRRQDPAAHSAADSPSSTSRRRRKRRRCDRQRKRGCRSGLTAKLNANPHRSPLPSIFLSNVRSLDNKIDHLQLELSSKRELRNCCALILTETWLNSTIPDNVVSLEGFATFRADRSSALSGKTRGGGLCIYINNNWCKNAMNVASYCSPDIELLTVNCRPFYLPREFTVVSITALYVPPSANTKEAMSVLYQTISELQSSHTEGVFIIAGDFNQANMKTVLHHFNQYVDFPTRGGNTLDLAYTNVRFEESEHP